MSRIFLSILLLITAHIEAARADTYTFGIVPQQAASKLARFWSPILAQISADSGVTLKFATAPNIPEFERRLANGEYDFSYMNPYHYTVFSRSPGYRAFAKQKDKLIHGILVVKQDSDITAIEQLAGTQLAFPSPAAFAASVLTRANLTQAGIPFQARYVSSHDSVYQGVAMGLFPAGGGIERTLGSVDEKLRTQLRILWRSKGYTPHAFAAHPRIPAEDIQSVRLAMTNLQNSPSGTVLLEGINFKGIESAHDADWDDVRALGVELLDSLINTPAIED